MYIGTYNGGKIDFRGTQICDISLEEITHALSLNNRFNGHTEHFWSVAQHSLLVADIAQEIYKGDKKYRNQLQLLALTHDFSEGYISDIARPIKKYLPTYREYESDIQDTIDKAVGLIGVPNRLLEVVRNADTIALANEAYALLNPCEQWIKDYEYMESTLAKSYIYKIKLESPKIVQSKLLKELADLGVSNTYKNNGYILNVFRNSEELPIIHNGKQIATVSERGNEYIITKHLGNGDFRKKLYAGAFIDNMMDIVQLIKTI